jgi:hypothetical protein
MYKGWSDPVTQLLGLQDAVRIIMEGQGNFRTRMDLATFALVFFRPEDFPERIRGRASKVLAVRRAVAVRYQTDTLFHFERLKPKERKALIADIMALYEACLIDIGRMGSDYEFMYPKVR